MKEPQIDYKNRCIRNCPWKNGESIAIYLPKDIINYTKVTHRRGDILRQEVKAADEALNNLYLSAYNKYLKDKIQNDG